METITLDSDISQGASSSFENGISNRNENSTSLSESGIPNGSSVSEESTGRNSGNYTSVPLNYFPNPSKNINCLLVGELVEAARCIVRNSATFVKCNETSGEKWQIRIPSETSIITVHFKNKEESIIREIQERSANERANVGTNNEVEQNEDSSRDTSDVLPSSNSKLKKLKVSEDVKPVLPIKDCFVKLDRLSLDTLEKNRCLRSGEADNNASDFPPFVKTIKTEVELDTEMDEMDIQSEELQKTENNPTSEHEDNSIGEIPPSTVQMHPVKVTIKKEIDTENTTCDGNIECSVSQRTQNVGERKPCTSCGFFSKSPKEQAMHQCNSSEDVVPVGGNFNHRCIKCQRYSENGGLCASCKNEKNAAYRNPSITATSYGSVPVARTSSKSGIDAPGEMYDSQGTSKQIHNVGVIQDTNVKSTMPFQMQHHASPVFASNMPKLIKDDPAMDTMPSMNGLDGNNKIAPHTISNANSPYMNSFHGKIGTPFTLSQEYPGQPSFPNAAGKSWDPSVRAWVDIPSAGSNFNEHDKVSNYSYLPNEGQPRMGYGDPPIIPKSMPELNSCSMVPSDQIQNGKMFVEKISSDSKGSLQHQYESPHITPMGNVIPVLSGYHSEHKGNLSSACALSEPYEVDVKPFVCEICKQAFIRQDLLKEHQQVHVQEKLYNCNPMIQSSHSIEDV